MGWGNVDRWWEDAGVSGKFMDRPQWDAMNADLKKGDTVVAYDISRCARNVRGLLNWIETLRARGVRLVLVRDQVDIESMSGRLLLSVLGAIAEWQREMIALKVREGMAAGKARGAVYGRKRSITDDQIEHAKRVLADGGTTTEAARAAGMTRQGLFKRIGGSRQYRDGGMA